MAINFPASPNNDDVYNVNNVAYVYNSTKNAWFVANSITSFTAGENMIIDANGLITANVTSGGTSYDSNTNSTGYFALPTGNTAQRDEGSANGHIRLNSENNNLELYYSGAWLNVFYVGRITATGGNSVNTVGNYKIHTFTSSGTFTVAEAPLGATVEYLMVGGGGAGGETIGGGGGGAEVKTGSVGVGEGSVYTITIGGGGSGGGIGSPQGTQPSYTYPGGTSGSYSTFVLNPAISVASLGGGGGGGFNLPGESTPGTTGGANGGGQGAGSGAGVAAGPNFYSGGTATNNNSGAGGGGAGAAGGPAVSGTCGAGGDGLATSFTGVTTYYGGGGGGGARLPNGGTGGAGGAGGGGAGGTGAVNGTDGTTNTGGGGGGGGYRDSPIFQGYGGNGGSGIVFIKYRVT